MTIIRVFSMASLIVMSSFAMAAKAPPTKKTTPPPVLAPTLLLQMEGKIFPKESFPESCKNFFQGAKCEVESYGRCHIESKKEGDLVYSRSVFSGPEGEQVIEQSWEKNGKVQKAIIENKAMQKLSQMEVKDGRVFYQITDLKDQKVKKSDDSAEDNLVVPSTIMSYIRPLFDKIAKGEKVQIKVAVLDRMDSFTFNIKKIRDEKGLDGEPIQVLEMSPASIIIKAAVDPMYFHIRTKTNEMFAFEGESALRKKVGDSWKKMSVRTGYEYKVNRAAANVDCDSTEVIFGKNAPKCEIKQ